MFISSICVLVLCDRCIMECRLLCVMDSGRFCNVLLVLSLIIIIVGWCC